MLALVLVAIPGTNVDAGEGAIQSGARAATLDRLPVQSVIAKSTTPIPIRDMGRSMSVVNTASAATPCHGDLLSERFQRPPLFSTSD